MRLIVCSNRLPLTIKRKEDGFEMIKSSGGLVTGIESLSNNIEFTWYGNISGLELTDEDKREIDREIRSKFNHVPIFIDNKLNDLCYDGFCNALLWPTLHSFPDNVCFTFDEYSAYKEYNEIFANKLIDDAKDGDIIWVHDYHLMLVPGIIKARRPDIKVMFFLHTPFCEPSNLKNLLCTEEILKSLSQCDIVGFHTPEFASNFTLSLKEYKIEKMPQVRAISIGIDPTTFRAELEKEKTIQKIQEIREKYKNKKILLGVDRTDYSKGIPQRFKGVERFLEKYPEYKDKFVFLQVAIPSRLSVQEYAGYVDQMNTQVEHINSTVGSLGQTVIKLIFNSVSFSDLCALYASADAILITSVADGMNLVAMEYVSCQDDKKGTVILSEHTGAGITLQGSLLHNSNNSEIIADSIAIAFSLSGAQRTTNYKINKYAVDNFTSIGWATQSLNRVSKNWKKSLGKK